MYIVILLWCQVFFFSKYLSEFVITISQSKITIKFFHERHCLREFFFFSISFIQPGPASTKPEEVERLERQLENYRHVVEQQEHLIEVQDLLMFDGDMT